MVASINKMIEKKNLLICTSILQVLNFISSVNLLKNNITDKNYIILIHPSLNDNQKVGIIIAEYAKIFNISLFNLTDIGNDVFDIQSTVNLGKLNFNFKNNIRNFDINLERLKVKFRNFVKENIGRIDNVFMRKSFKRLDFFFYKSIEDNFKTYLIDDGMGDYLDERWHIKNLIFYEIKHSVKFFINKNILFILYKIFSKNGRNYNYLYYKINKYEKYFTNILGKKIVNSVLIKNEFKKVIKYIYSLKVKKKSVKVILLGSLIGEDPEKYNCLYTSDKILVYNQIINKIQNKHSINNIDIWYLPHPRLSLNTYNILKKKLNCSIYDYNNHSTAETEFCNNALIAVYSITSTSLLYSKLIFDLDSYYINIQSLKDRSHPTHYLKSHSIFRSFNFKEIEYENK